MDFASALVIILRLIFGPLILRFPLGGILISIALDSFDAPLIDIIGKKRPHFWGDIVDYYLLDTWLDLYYFAFALLVALSWENALVRNTAIFLFLIRALGVIIFSLTGLRSFLFFFPNVFEMFFIYFLAAARWLPQLVPDTLSKLLIVIIILAAPKLIIEYFLHLKKLKGMEIIKLFIPIKTEAPTIWEWFKTKFLKS